MSKEVPLTDENEPGAAGTVRRHSAMHAGHLQRQRIGVGEAAHAHERGCHGNVRLSRNSRQLACGIACDHAATDVEQGTFRLVNGLRQSADLLGMSLGGRLVTAYLQLFRPLRFRSGPLHIFGYVDQDRSRLAGARNMERLCDNSGQVVR